MDLPAGIWSRQPVAILATMETTKLPKPPMGKYRGMRWREQAARNVSERRVDLESGKAGLDTRHVLTLPFTHISDWHMLKLIMM